MLGMFNVYRRNLKFCQSLASRRGLPRNCFLHNGCKSLQKLANLQAFPTRPALISFL
jgi:hypothetical protein